MSSETTSAANTLRGRDAECAALDVLLKAARGGESRAMVLRGEAGIGKTALLEFAIGSTRDFRVLRAVGVESEMELPFASLHQLCAPILETRASIPVPQRNALGVAFGLNGGPPPDRFLVALATLSMLDEIANERPLLCVIDDAQWLDSASALALGLVARRMLAEPIAFVFAVRVPFDVRELAGLPEMVIGGLGDDDARELLGAGLPGRIDERVGDRIVAEAGGNPLALLEMPRELALSELAGGFGVPDTPLTSRMEQSFLRRVTLLPAETRQLLLVAAADPLGDPILFWRAASRLGLGPADLAPAEEAGLIRLSALVGFRHPLVRSAIYQAATPQDRQDAHRVLAESIDSEVDPDRRAWHRAHAAPGPDEDVAEELERSANRAQARGGIAATAAFLERATALTPDPVRQAQRALDAAQAKLQAGTFDVAASLVAMAEAGVPDELGRARIDLLQAQIAFVQSRGNEATPLLLAAAHRFERLDVATAREIYLDAIAAAIFAGRLARGPGLVEVGAAARAAPPAPDPSRLPDRLLDAFSIRLSEGRSAAAPAMRPLLAALCDEEIPVQGALRWLWFGTCIGADLWDHDRWQMVVNRHMTIIREAGALSELPHVFDAVAHVHLVAGDLATATSVVEESRMVCEATGTVQARLGPLGLAAMRGNGGEVQRLLAATMREAVPRGQGGGFTMAHYYHALCCNALTDYADALTAAQIAASQPEEFGAPFGTLELVEAAVRSGKPGLATLALEELSAATTAAGTDWAGGVEARSRALLNEGDVAEELYREAIERLAHTAVRVELARAHLVFGEWLRHEERRAEARQQLRRAHDMFTEMGVEGFAERSRNELIATGATARRREDTGSTLTPQEAQIARLARDGLSNPEIGERLFISPRTVQYHLHKVFTKLDINSRNQLGRVPSRLLELA